MTPHVSEAKGFGEMGWKVDVHAMACWAWATRVGSPAATQERQEANPWLIVVVQRQDAVTQVLLWGWVKNNTRS